MAQSPEGKRAFGQGRSVLNRATNVTALGTLQQVFEEQGLDLADLGNVKMVWAKTKTEPIKDDDGNEVGQKEVYAGSSVLLSPSWEEGPKWVPVDRAPVNKFIVSKKRAKGAGVIGRWKTAFIMPDPQVGYRRLNDGSLDPFHDPRALDVAFQLMAGERPELTIWLGDVLDFAPFSTKFRYDPAFALTVQPTIDRGAELMAMTRELSGEVRFIEGNHDMRISTYIIDNAREAYGIRRAGSTPDDWPVMSVPYLLRLDELGVKYVDGYPNGATYINDNLAAIHGKVLDIGTVANNEQVSIIQGHVHRIGVAAKTRNSRGAPKFSVALSPGCLCRIDGAVPATNASITAKGRPARSWENWQQGVAVVRYTDDGLFTWDIVPIFEGWTRYDGQEITSELSVNDR